MLSVTKFIIYYVRRFVISTEKYQRIQLVFFEKTPEREREREREKSRERVFFSAICPRDCFYHFYFIRAQTVTEIVKFTIYSSKDSSYVDWNPTEKELLERREARMGSVWFLQGASFTAVAKRSRKVCSSSAEGKRGERVWRALSTGGASYRALCSGW